jgi:pyruvate dehydrogenase E1 component alpha subunit
MQPATSGDVGGEGGSALGGGPAARVLADDGTLAPSCTSPLDLAGTQALYTALVRARALDLRFVDLQRRGDIPFHASAIGREGGIVGAAFAMEEGDALFPSPRELMASATRGVPVASLVHQAMGTSASVTKGKSPPTQVSGRAHGVVSVSGIAGAQLPHATGFGWAARMRGDTKVALGMVSGGAFVTGDFHNALNFAGVSKANVVFVVVVEGLRGLSATATVAEKAEAYGLPSIRVDGNDVLCVVREVSAAIARARRGEGATLVEVVTASPEATEDGIITLSETSCPVALLERHIAHLGANVAELRASAERAIDAEVRAAVDDAKRAGPPPLASLVEDVFAHVPSHLRAQLEALR